MTSNYHYMNEPFTKYLLRQIHGLLPGISMVLGMYYDNNGENHKMVLSYINKDGEREINEMHHPEMLGRLQRISKDLKKEKSWINANKIDLDYDIESHHKITLFTELENTVLVLKIFNQHTGHDDLIVFYFEKTNMLSFSVEEENVLKTEHKQLIGNLIYNHIEVVRHQFNEMKKVRSLYKEQMEKMVFTIDKMTKASHKEKEKQKEKLSAYCIDLLNAESEKYKINFIFESEALEKIIESEASISSFPKIIQEACAFATNLSLSDEKDMHIKAAYIFTDDNILQENYQPEESLSVKQTRFDETKKLLDDYERAAKVLFSKNKKIIGKTMGEELHKSGSAITQNISTHKDRIIKLMKENPDSWRIIKMEFQPIKNILKQA